MIQNMLCQNRYIVLSLEVLNYNCFIIIVAEDKVTFPARLKSFALSCIYLLLDSLSGETKSRRGINNFNIF